MSHHGHHHHGHGCGQGGGQSWSKRPFLIVSDMHGKVLDIHGGSAHPGAHLCAWPRKPGHSPNQQWYMDQSGYIRSMLNDFTLECKSQGDKITMQPYSGNPRQLWVFSGNKVINQSNQHECLDIARESKADGADVISWKYKGSVNQHWHLEYV